MTTIKPIPTEQLDAARDALMNIRLQEDAIDRAQNALTFHTRRWQAATQGLSIKQCRLIKTYVDRALAPRPALTEAEYVQAMKEATQ